MALRFEPQTSVAHWWSQRDEPWVQLCSLGPSGFEVYAQIFHPMVDGGDPFDRDDVGNVTGDLADDQLSALGEVLARHTTTPDNCYFGLWDGFGELFGSPRRTILQLSAAGEPDPPPPAPIPTAFDEAILAGPKVRIPSRDYFLFRGPLGEAGEWGAAPGFFGRPRRINSPNLMWPEDRAWFAATEIDLPWTGVGGSRALVDEIVADPRFDADAVTLGMPLRYHRHFERYCDG